MKKSNTINNVSNDTTKIINDTTNIINHTTNFYLGYYKYGRFQSKTAFQPLKCPQIPFSQSFAVTKPLMLSSIPFKTINIIPFRSPKCKKNLKKNLERFLKNI